MPGFAFSFLLIPAGIVYWQQWMLLCQIDKKRRCTTKPRLSWLRKRPSKNSYGLIGSSHPSISCISTSWASSFVLSMSLSKMRQLYGAAFGAETDRVLGWQSGQGYEKNDNMSLRASSVVGLKPRQRCDNCDFVAGTLCMERQWSLSVRRFR